MFKKLFLSFLFLTTCYLLHATKSFAADPNFNISATANYEIQEDGVTKISQTITIENKTDFYFTPSYTVSVGFNDIENVQAFNQDGTIPTTLDEKNPDNKSIKLSFPKRYAGVDTKNTFTLKFTTKDIAARQGSIWEITIPGIDASADFASYNSTITVPKSFGKAQIIKPNVQSAEGEALKLTKDEVGKAGVYILFGDKQYYKFSLKYNISNPNLFPVRTEIALPSKTNYQDVIINSFSVKPLNVTTDPDGNWIAEYRLLPQQKQTVIVDGLIEIYPAGQIEELSSIQRQEYIKPKKYWDSGSLQIQQASKALKSPKEIYDFVVEKLSYNHAKIATDNLRLGGEGVLKDTKNSVCLEFTDLFISLARANGIPARSVEGFAYTQNTKLRPLSLVNDILHAWPEYYDDKKKMWIMVDPTWGKTTKGMDYFNSLDYSHVAFTVKGSDSEYPIPAGGYKFNRESKDVSMEFSNEKEFKKSQKLELSDSFPNFSFPKMTLQGTITVENRGNASYKDLVLQIVTSIGTKRQFLIDDIPPGGSKKITTSFTDVPLLTNSDYVITIQVGKESYTKKVRISFIPDVQLILIIGGLIGGSIIIAAITYSSGSLLIQRRKRKNSIRR